MAARARGYKCVLTMGGSTLGVAKNVDVTVTVGEQDITCRDNAGYESAQGGLRKLALAIEALWVPTNAAMLALMGAFDAQSSVAFSALDENGYGWQGDCIVTELRRGPENQADAVMCNVSARSTGVFYRVIAGTTTTAP